jgi:hypothetical protein
VLEAVRSDGCAPVPRDQLEADVSRRPRRPRRRRRPFLNRTRVKWSPVNGYDPRDGKTRNREDWPSWLTPEGGDANA